MKFLRKLWWKVKSTCVRHYFGNPSRKLKVIGVTGTNGKTTTTTLLYKVATVLGYKSGLIGTVENIIGGEVRPVTHTTPDSVALTKLFHEMLDKGCEYVFMEVSSHALDQGRVAGVTFAGGVFTNLTHDHLDYHKSFEEYLKAKKKLFDMLPPESFALSNADDENGKKILEGTRAKKYMYEFKNVSGPATYEENFVGEIIKADSTGLELMLGEKKIKSKLLGKFNASNLLAVWSTTKLLGFDEDKVNKILENIKPPKGRFEAITSPKGSTIIIDYAHTPDALEKVLTAIHEIKDKETKIISVFGCGGDRDPMKRPKMGEIGAKMSDMAIFTSDNPRSEDPEMIIEAMKEYLSPDMLEKVHTAPDRRMAIKLAYDSAGKGDIILCAGKGHEDYQVLKTGKVHFDDREEFEKLF